MAIPAPAADFYNSLAQLLAKAEQPVAQPNRRPGRPVKSRMETVPVILHLYKDQVRWLDGYADLLAGLSPENARLSRVEIVRALLLALAQFAAQHRVQFAPDTRIRTERELQAAVVAALGP